ncbi:cysteine--tRNA ligase [Rarobacter incanus]|uniref:Cysteine--tRNA ligase n=1 Tax=Rarobacter incanus TaxID=153494 RepID=A0A542SP54_9MICO|nr:cysteine--tRNA ligase [Rarobacter incanus]TQK76338.1 cysteinyl-tRNA synthetase [Rarobacter incanus]
MALQLFDTATRTVRPFVPRVAGQVGIYVCGATVQSPPHIGHMRSAVAFDILVRWLRRAGNKVTMVRNVTDIDDKILAKAARAGEPWWAWAYINEQYFTAAYDALGNLRPTYEPHATGHVPEMIELMERLIARGHAYTTTPGNVYFDTGSWPQYGSLTNQRDDATLAGDGEGAGDDGSAKRDPRDFALWKAPKDGEPATASWHTPFGVGRPGWHLECSAMATRYLGPEFDIHGGGLDLRFPHHENEMAQSNAAGDGFARYWMHSAWVTVAGAKMGKSLGNGLAVTEILREHEAAVLRLALGGAQYSSMIEWSEQTLHDAAANWARFSGFVQRASERVGTVSEDEVGASALDLRAVRAFDDNLNVPAALAVVHDLVRDGNSALADADDSRVREALVQVRAILDVLGLDPGAPQWASARDNRAMDALGYLVEAQLAVRKQARAERDFATADRVRDVLTAAGIHVEDGPAGARWTLLDNEKEQ